MESSLRKLYVEGGKMKANIMKDESSDDEGGEEDMALINKEDPLASTRAEMGEAVQENQRLRMNLDKIKKEYRSLQMQFQDILQHEAITTKSTTNGTTPVSTDQEKHDNLVSLSLGRTTLIDVKKIEDTRIFTPNKVKENEKKDAHEKGLALGLDSKFEKENNQEIILCESSIMTPEKGIEDVNEEAGETWKSQKILKRNVEDEISQENPTNKRVRVSLRVRCDTPTMNDGCQWRKYGQKIAKGNPCPRAYYRCTVAANCPVRKQVQRCAEDISILITTYEGTHNHPLAVGATTIASTTSAAARMFLSGSSTSSPSANTSNQTSTIPSTNINGLNYYLSADNSKAKPFYIPNSSIVSSSPSSFPTITLDLTSTPSSSSFSPFSRMSSFSPRYPSTNLDFSSSESNMMPFSWSTNGVLSHGASNSSKNSSNQINSLNFQRQPFIQENIHQPYTLVEATKAITSDPKFQSALAIALSSIIGSNGRNNNHGSLVDNNNNKPTTQNLRIGSDQSFPILSSFASTQNASNYQSGSRFSLHPSPSFPVSKSKSTSPDVGRDHNL